MCTMYHVICCGAGLETRQRSWLWRTAAPSPADRHKKGAKAAAAELHCSAAAVCSTAEPLPARSDSPLPPAANMTGIKREQRGRVEWNLQVNPLE